MYKILAKFTLALHNFAYKLSSIYAAKAEGGLHPKHRLMNLHKFFLDNIDARDTVFDIGCGNGAIAFDIAKKAKYVVGIDKNERNIAIAKKKYTAETIEYIVGDARRDLPNRTFDVVVLSNVLEHIESRIEFLKQVKQRAPKFLIRVPMINRDWITLYKKELGVEWRSDKTHFTEYTIESFQKEMREAELRIISYSVQFGELWAVTKSIE